MSNPPPPSWNTPPTSIPLAGSRQSHSAAIRETIESVAIAFVLAFLFRTFEAEAFVIPTGSMAPTLMGRHKDLVCPECGANFQVSASEEVERDGSMKQIPQPVNRCICPMCRYVLKGAESPVDQPSFNGDRILVNKFAYEFNDPKRWDVIVFKFPDKAQDNYIKRLIGLPEETIKVHRGDIYVSRGQGEFEIARKPPEKLRVMLQPVFDNDLMPKIEKEGLPVRWRAEASHTGAAKGEWTSTDHAKYELDGSAAGETWLHYEHRVPMPHRGDEPSRAAGDSIKPQLISDFVPYDAGSSENRRELPVNFQEFSGLHWVGDLAVECQAQVENDSGVIVMELVKGGRRFQCRLNVATGQADMKIVGEDEKSFHPQAKTSVRGPGKYNLMFANCDRKLYLWVGDSAVRFEGGDAATEYGELNNVLPTTFDLQPVSIASDGVKMKLDHLKVFRDIYYTATNYENQKLQNDPRNRPNNETPFIPMCDYRLWPMSIKKGDFQRFFSDPREWTAFSEDNMDEAIFNLSKDQFFAMGDNSSKSSDSRFWGNVPRDLLIGKAFFVYWPHPLERIPGTPIPFPFFPNFPRMGFVR